MSCKIGLVLIIISRHYTRLITFGPAEWANIFTLWLSFGFMEANKPCLRLGSFEMTQKSFLTANLTEEWFHEHTHNHPWCSLDTQPPILFSEISNFVPIITKPKGKNFKKNYRLPANPRWFCAKFRCRGIV